MLADFLKDPPGISVHGLWGNSLADWIIAAIVFAAVWASLSIVKRLIVSRHAQLVGDPKKPTLLRLFCHLIAQTRQFFVLSLALYLGQVDLTFPDRLQHAVNVTGFLLLLFQIGLWAGAAVRFYLQIKEAGRDPDRAVAGSLGIIRFVAYALIWSLLFLVALENFGVNITALLAGLGVGGVAVALALQNVLGDLFASLSIALDKPFSVGDRLMIDTYAGVVEHVGIKTTRLRSEGGEQIILSNADLLKSRLRNFGRASELRILAPIRVGYATPSETLREIPKLLKIIVSEQQNARFERCHLTTIADSCLQFDLSYFVRQPKVNPVLDLQQAVNLRIVEEFRRLGVEFAYPAQRVVIDRERLSGYSA
jgi:small-conductance mechanosensitive channel